MQIWRHIETREREVVVAAFDSNVESNRLCCASSVYLQVCRQSQKKSENGRMGERAWQSWSRWVKGRGERELAAASRLINRANSGTNLKPVYMATCSSGSRRGRSGTSSRRRSIAPKSINEFDGEREPQIFRLFTINISSIFAKRRQVNKQIAFASAYLRAKCSNAAPTTTIAIKRERRQ